MTVREEERKRIEELRMRLEGQEDELRLLANEVARKALSRLMVALDRYDEEYERLKEYAEGEADQSVRNKLMAQAYAQWNKVLDVAGRIGAVVVARSRTEGEKDERGGWQELVGALRGQRALPDPKEVVIVEPANIRKVS